MAEGSKAFLLLGILVFYGALGVFLASGNYVGNSEQALNVTTIDWNYNRYNSNNLTSNNTVTSTFRQCTFVDAVVQLFGSNAQCGDTYNSLTGGGYQEMTQTIDSSTLGIKNIITNINGFGIWLDLILLSPLLITLIYIITSSYEISILGFKIGGSGG